jgi:hypothetical protein
MICISEEIRADVIVSTLEAAWTQLGLFTNPDQDERRPVPAQFGKLFNDTLDRILRSLNLGSAAPFGAQMTRNKNGTSTDVESYYFVHIKGDVDEGIRIRRGLSPCHPARETEVH